MVSKATIHYKEKDQRGRVIYEALLCQHCAAELGSQLFNPGEKIIIRTWEGPSEDCMRCQASEEPAS